MSEINLNSGHLPDEQSLSPNDLNQQMKEVALPPLVRSEDFLLWNDLYTRAQEQLSALPTAREWRSTLASALLSAQTAASLAEATFGAGSKEALESAKLYIKVASEDETFPDVVVQDLCRALLRQNLNCLDDPKLFEAQIHTYLSLSFSVTKRLAEAVAEAKIALQLLSEIDASDADTALASYAQGTAFCYQSNWDEAEKYFLDSICLDRDGRESFSFKLTLAYMYLNQERFLPARGLVCEILNGLDMELDLAKHRSAHCLELLGGIAFAQGEYNACIKHLGSAEQIWRSLPGCERDLVQCRAAMGRTLEKLGEIKKAISVWEEALHGAKELSLVELEEKILLGLTVGYLEYGDGLNDSPNEQQQAFESATVLAECLITMAEERGSGRISAYYRIAARALYRLNPMNVMAQQYEEKAQRLADGYDQ